MEYKLTSIERKTAKNGAAFAVVFVQDSEGQEFKAAIWKDSKFRGVFPNFDTLAVGQTIEGDLKVSGEFTNFEPPKGVQIKTAGGYKSVQIEKAQDHKAELIDKFQDKKQESIQLAGAMRDATLITLASLKDQPFPDDEDFKREYEAWVKYLLNLGNQPFV